MKNILICKMRYHLTIILLFFTFLLSAQIKTFSYLGTLIISKNIPISFQLELEEQNGIVNGYSLTNLGKADETKSEINGLYFKSDNSFQLQETQILQTSSEAPLNTFCYINMNLSFKGNFGSKRLEGKFTGNFLDSTLCASGKIILMKKSKIEKQIKKIKNKVTKKNTDTNLIKRTEILKDGDNFTIKWEANKVNLYIWDANQEDGDKITLKINGDIILHDFETKNKRKKVKYQLENDENIIEITAVNTGTSPPNTSRIELVDSKTKYPIITQLEIGKSAIIKIVK